jgi:type IV secretion system protein VirB10
VGGAQVDAKETDAVIKAKDDKADEGRRLRRRRLLAFWAAAGIGIGCLLAVLWSAFKPRQVHAVMTPEQARLQSLVERKRTEARASANRLRQHRVGEGIRFDEQGNLLGAPPSADELLPNKTLNEAIGAVGAAERKVDEKAHDKVAALTREVEEAARAEVEEVEREVPPPRRVNEEERPRRGRRVRGGSESEKDEEEFGARSALAYSTVSAASWARQRPDAPGSAKDGGGTVRAGVQEEGLSGEEDAMDRLAMAAEQALRNPSGQGLPGTVFPSGEMGGSSASGSKLYASERGLPAVRASQGEAGDVGDMRIGGAVPTTVVRQGKFLDCELTHELRADLVESPVTAMVGRDFISLDQKHVLVPAGAKLIGSAGRVQNVQQSRVYIRFERIIYPDQRTAWFPRRDVPALDASGAIGVDGDVDRHFLLQFGSAIVLGVLDGLAAAVQGRGGADPSLQALVTGKTSANMTNVLVGIIGRYGNVVPTVTVPAGARLKVYFSEDVELTPYMATSDLSSVRGAR